LRDKNAHIFCAASSFLIRLLTRFM
jgi:hypothetical protein